MRLSSASVTVGVDDGYATGGWTDLRHGVERDAVVGAVGRGRDDHVAAGADPLLQELVVGDQGVGGFERRIRRDRIFAVVYVHVTVAGIGRRLELGRFRSRGPRHLLREGRCTAERARSGRQCHHAGGLHQAATVEWAIHGIPPLMLVADDASERPYSYCAAEKRDELASLHAPTRHIQCESLALCDRGRVRNGKQPSANSFVGAMSALGHKRTCAAHKPMSALCQ
jgi:hypothetical protein